MCVKTSHAVERLKVTLRGIRVSQIFAVKEKKSRKKGCRF